MDFTEEATNAIRDLDNRIDDLSYKFEKMLTLTPVRGVGEKYTIDKLAQTFETHEIATSTYDCMVLAEYCLDDLFPLIWKRVEDLGYVFLSVSKVSFKLTLSRQIHCSLLVTVIPRRK